MMQAACYSPQSIYKVAELLQAIPLDQALCRKLTLQRELFVQHAVVWELKSWRDLQEITCAHYSPTYSKDAKTSQASDFLHTNLGVRSFQGGAKFSSS